MREIIIRRTHGKTPIEARAAAERIAAQLAEKYDLTTTWEDEQLRFKRPGLAGELTLVGTQAILTIRLGAFFTALKPVIEREVAEYIDENFSL